MSNPSPTLPVVVKILTDIVVGGIIRKASNVPAKAAQVVAVCAALTQINSGDSNAGIAALDAALVTPQTDPADQAALLSGLTWLAAKAAALQQLGGGTIIGSVNTALLNGVLAEATTIAQAYASK